MKKSIKKSILKKLYEQVYEVSCYLEENGWLFETDELSSLSNQLEQKLDYVLDMIKGVE